MPYVRISMVGKKTLEQKEAVAEAITDTLVEQCNVHSEHVYVVFEDVCADDWMVGGETVSERRRKRGE